MTGFARTAAEFQGSMVSIELGSVNHRYLDVSLRLPNEWASLDPEIREALREKLSRGKITANVNRRRGGSPAQTLKFDQEIARQYVEASANLSALLGNGEELSLSTLAQLQGVFYYEQNEEDLEETKEFLVTIVQEAVDKLEEMRLAEGRVLCLDLMARIEAIRSSLARVEERLPTLTQAYEEKLRGRIEELNLDKNITEERLSMEVALMAERGDVTEECVRLKAHLDHAVELLESDEAVGRKLNFLSQEIQREINTLGAKIRDTDVARETLEMKSELDRIREQIQNIE